MQPLDVIEWLEGERLKCSLAADFASEALETLSDNRTEDFYSVEEDLTRAADQIFAEPWRMVEFFIDRHQLLAEMADTLDKAGFQGDPDDALDNALAELLELRERLAELEPEPLKAPLSYDL